MDNLDNSSMNLKKLDEAVDEGIRRGLILVRGPFQSGKTRLLKQFLKHRNLPEKEHYLILNRYLIDVLKHEMAKNQKLTFSSLAVLKAKTASYFEKYIEDYLQTFFKKKDILIIDSVELLLNYSINLPRIAYRFCCDRNCIIISLPFDPHSNFQLNWNLNISKIIDI